MIDKKFDAAPIAEACEQVPEKEQEKEPDYQYTIQLTMGDWSHDGHNQTDTVTILSTLSKNDLVRAFVEGMKIVGLKPQRHDTYLPFCDDYEDSILPKFTHELLVEQGILVPDTSESTDDLKYLGNVWVTKYDGYDGYELSIDQDGYLHIWLEIARAGNPAFEYRVVDFSHDNINIGGYGLFYG